MKKKKFKIGDTDLLAKNKKREEEIECCRIRLQDFQDLDQF